MKRILAIADDLTGAAEIAGIGLRYGLPSRLVLDPAQIGEPCDGLCVINADTRSLPEADARRIVADLGRSIGDQYTLFKKIDSVLRGHVSAELEALLEGQPRFDRVLLIPQNPSRGRVVQTDGTYLVEGVPLARTSFARDPDHPTRTSNVVERIGRSSRTVVFTTDAQAPLAEGTITVPAAETTETIDAFMRQRTPGTLVVGGADAFAAMLRAEGCSAQVAASTSDPSGRRLFVCGSTSTAARRALRNYAAARGMDVIDANPDRACASISRIGVAIIMSPEIGGIEAEPREIEQILADAARKVITRCACEWVFAEGGATATAVCQAMQWTSLEVEAELAPGVVVLKSAAQVRLVIKPGSYAWPTRILASS